jgi:hypothetical protein
MFSTSNFQREPPGPAIDDAISALSWPGVFRMASLTELTSLTDPRKAGPVGGLQVLAEPRADLWPLPPPLPPLVVLVGPAPRPGMLVHEVLPRMPRALHDMRGSSRVCLVRDVDVSSRPRQTQICQ